MPKLVPTVRVGLGPSDYTLSVILPRTHDNKWLRDHPGCMFSGNKKTGAWTVPKDLWPGLQEECAGMNLVVDEAVWHSPVECTRGASKHLLPPQQAISDHFCSPAGWPGGFIDGEMGTGKTGMALDIIERLALSTVLVAVPGPGVRSAWIDSLTQPQEDLRTGELFRWTGQRRIVAPTKGKEVALLTQADVNGAITIITYGMISKLYGCTFDGIIPDECHHLKNPKAQRTTAFGAIMTHNLRERPWVFRLGLSGTPITHATHDLFTPQNLLFPMRFSSFFRYTQRYCHVVVNKAGYPEYHGISLMPDRQAELRQRNATFRPRITQRDVDKYLPPLLTQVHRLSMKPSGDLQALGRQKLKPVLEWVSEMLYSKDAHVVLTPHHVEVAQEYHAALQAANIPTALVHGQIPESKRRKSIQRLRTQRSSVLVATMGSIAEGLNLFDYVDHVALVELTYEPRIVTQLLGRFRRLNRSKPCRVHLFFAEGSIEYVLVMALKHKLADIQKAIGHGVSESGSMELLEEARTNKAEIRRQLNAIFDKQGIDPDGWDNLFEDEEDD